MNAKTWLHNHYWLFILEYFFPPRGGLGPKGSVGHTMDRFSILNLSVGHMPMHIPHHVFICQNQFLIFIGLTNLAIFKVNKCFFSTSLTSIRGRSSNNSVQWNQEGYIRGIVLSTCFHFDKLSSP